MLLLVIAVHSVLLGAFTWVGFVLGDLLVSDDSGFRSMSLVERWLGTPLAPIEHWLLVAVLVVLIPLSVLAFRIEIRRMGWHTAVGDTGERVVNVAFATLFTWVWVTALPVLVRPIFTLRGDDPAPEAVAPAQQFWWVLVGTPWWPGSSGWRWNAGRSASPTSRG